MYANSFLLQQDREPKDIGDGVLERPSRVVILSKIGCVIRLNVGSSRC
jgi:hypothetical protein